MKKKIQSWFLFSSRDCLITLFILVLITVIAFLFHAFDGSNVYVPMLFVLAVFLISRYTNGYLFGTLSSFLGIILVNYIFTYPFFEFNFTISGYPITFICMFATSVMTSTMTTQIKQQEKIKIETEKEKMRGNLLRAVSHDLRTPLTSILGTTSALLENGDKISKEKQVELLKESRDDAQWLIRMVENILSITRINSGRTKINKTNEAVEEIVGEVVQKFNKRYPNAEISVLVPDELLMIPMDAILIEQVLINLLENAIVHGKALSKIRLTVTKDGENAIFIVQDSGQGIPDKVFEHLFDGYLSGSEESESDSKRNMGIGLSVCMSIVKAHGGAMDACNCPEGGAVFRFTLPLKEE